MIKIQMLNGTETGQFKNYHELFEYLTTIENLKLIAKCPDFKQMNWSFKVHSHGRVAALYSYTKDSATPIAEAFEHDLSLIEICSGDYNNPVYMAATPNVDLDDLKAKWCLDYCTAHKFILKESFEAIGSSKMIKEHTPCFL